MMFSSKFCTKYSARGRCQAPSACLSKRKNGHVEANLVKAILAIQDANTSYSRLTIMYYRRAQPTTRGLEMVVKKATKKSSLKRAPAKKAAKKTAAKKAPAKKTAAKKPAKKAAKKK